MTTVSPTTLSPPQQLVAACLVYGLSNKAIAHRVHRSVHTVDSHLRIIRNKLNLPRCSRAVLVNALLQARLVVPPPHVGSAPDFDDAEMKLLEALSRHDHTRDIAEAVGLDFPAVRNAIGELVAKAKADNPVHLVALACTWALLDVTGPRTNRAPSPPSSPSPLSETRRSTHARPRWGDDADTFDVRARTTTDTSPSAAARITEAAGIDTADIDDLIGGLVPTAKTDTAPHLVGLTHRRHLLLPAASTQSPPAGRSGMTCSPPLGSRPTPPAAATPSPRSPAAERAQDTVVGPDWEVLLLPRQLARPVMATLAEGSAAVASAVGLVFAHSRHCGLFLPTGSKTPARPADTTYLKAGTTITLPGQRPAPDLHWVRLADGPPISRPLLLHPIVTLHAASPPAHRTAVATTPTPARSTMNTPTATPPTHPGAVTRTSREMVEVPVPGDVKGRMLRQARHGVSMLGVLFDGPERVWGWQGSSLSLPVLASSGCAPLWMKLRSRPADEPAPVHWSGVATAERVVTGLPILRPLLLATETWTSDGSAYQAEVSTRIPGRSFSPSREAPAHVAHLPTAWWSDLRAALDSIQDANPTGLAPVGWQEAGARSAGAVGPAPWVPSHGDLCWANLGALGDRAVLYDWDTFGLGPRHADAAGLFLTSLDSPEVAARVREHFGDQLDSPEGIYAQLVMGAHWTQRFRDGDHVDLAPALLAHMSTIRDQLHLPEPDSAP